MSESIEQRIERKAVELLVAIKGLSSTITQIEKEQDARWKQYDEKYRRRLS